MSQIQKRIPFSILIQDDNAHNIRHLLWLITHEYNHYTSGSWEITRYSMLSLFIVVTRLYEYQLGKAIPMVTKNLILEVRMAKAKEMLRTTTHTITEIANYCGYPSVSSFQRSFKKSEDLTPSEYRKT